MADLIDGVVIKMGGKEYTVPPLNFKRIRALKPQIEQLSTSNSTLNDEQMDVAIEVVHSAMERNYPDLRKEHIEEMLDLGNVHKVLSAIMGVSGMQASGEAVAGG